MDKDLIVYNIVRIFRERGYEDNQIAEFLHEINNKLEKEVV